jgi:hypothetical protein
MMLMDIDLTKVQLLKWPEDASTIAQLSLIEKQCWYAGQEPRKMVYLGQNREFVRFWKFSYLYPLKVKRMFYKMKHMFWGNWF